MKRRIGMTICVLFTALPLHGQSVDSFRAAVREALEHPPVETAPGRYTSESKIFFSFEVDSDRTILRLDQLQHAADPFPLELTLPSTVMAGDRDTASVRLRVPASNPYVGSQGRRAD